MYSVAGIAINAIVRIEEATVGLIASTFRDRLGIASLAVHIGTAAGPHVLASVICVRYIDCSR